MDKNRLETLLNAYQPDDANEIAFKKHMLDFLYTHPNCFERSLEEGHFTASCWLVNKSNDKALLLHHFKLDQWFQLGGHCDGDPDVLAVALKEAQEESGITEIVPLSTQIFDLDIHLIPENKKDKAHLHYDVRFLLQVVSDESVKQNRESKELRWIGANINDLPTDNPSVIRMHQKWVNLTN